MVEVPAARAAVCVAHGAGGDMHNALLEGFSASLNSAAYTTLRFNFPYSEQGRKSPDRPDVLIETWGAVVDEAAFARSRAPGLRGGEVHGRAHRVHGRSRRLEGERTRVHRLSAPSAGQAREIRDEHLYRVRVPTPFLQGTDDAFARWDVLELVLRKLGRWEQYDG